MKFFIFSFLFLNILIYAQIVTPLEKSNYSSLTSNKELIDFINEVVSNSIMIEYDTLAFSHGGKIVPLLKISKSKFGTLENKIKVLIFAQQHGNEQSGKEGALRLLKEIALGNLNYLFERIDLLLIPQMNPDGSDLDMRRNGKDVDLNRNHAILSEPEVIGLHNIFHKYLPEASLDIHEYRAMSENWIKFGYRKNFDQQIGMLTNPNIDIELIDYQKKEFLPFIKKYLSNYGFSYNEYIVGGPPNLNRIRYSTVDINDGRQSFGVQNTFSFIVEGKKESKSIENIKHRTEGQYRTMIGFLEFIDRNHEKIKTVVNRGRKKLIENSKENLAVQMEHIGEGPVDLTLYSIMNCMDTTISITNFHGKINVEKYISRPYGYLINKMEKEIIDLLKKHKIVFHNFQNSLNHKIYQYLFVKKDSVNLEELSVFLPIVDKIEFKKANYSEFYFVPLNQIQSNLIMLLFEPQSMMNLMQYKEFSQILASTDYYPILRVEEIDIE